MAQLTAEEITWGKIYIWIHQRAEYLRKRDAEEKEIPPVLPSKVSTGGIKGQGEIDAHFQPFDSKYTTKTSSITSPSKVDKIGSTFDKTSSSDVLQQDDLGVHHEQ